MDGDRRFVFQKGPLFTNLVLADEINRASPKTQSALLEAMQEHQVTSMGEAHALPEPFYVLATQNPIDLEGTYPLPEAQLDRFLFKLNLEPGGADVLQRIVEERLLGEPVRVEPQLEAGGWTTLMRHTRRVYLPPVVANYIARLVHATRKGASTAAEAIHIGAGPRAGIGLAAAGRAPRPPARTRQRRLRRHPRLRPPRPPTPRQTRIHRQTRRPHRRRHLPSPPRRNPRHHRHPPPHRLPHPINAGVPPSTAQEDRSVRTPQPEVSYAFRRTAQEDRSRSTNPTSCSGSGSIIRICKDTIRDYTKFLSSAGFC